MLTSANEMILSLEAELKIMKGKCDSLPEEKKYMETNCKSHCKKLTTVENEVGLLKKAIGDHIIVL